MSEQLQAKSRSRTKSVSIKVVEQHIEMLKKWGIPIRGFQFHPDGGWCVEVGSHDGPVLDIEAEVRDWQSKRAKGAANAN